MDEADDPSISVHVVWLPTELNKSSTTESKSLESSHDASDDVFRGGMSCVTIVPVSSISGSRVVGLAVQGLITFAGMLEMPGELTSTGGDKDY